MMIWGQFEIDQWTLWGMLAQSLFFGSFVVQWWKSEKRKESYLPVEFWLLRLTASIILLAYVWVRRDAVFLISLILQIGIYLRNINLINQDANRRN